MHPNRSPSIHLQAHGLLLRFKFPRAKGPTFKKKPKAPIHQFPVLFSYIMIWIDITSDVHENSYFKQSLNENTKSVCYQVLIRINYHIETKQFSIVLSQCWFFIKLWKYHGQYVFYCKCILKQYKMINILLDRYNKWKNSVAIRQTL